ncbi:MAG: RNA polymerase sigma factor [Spirosomataceae bacterium]
MKDEKALVKACAKGDGSAFEELYRRFASKMLVVCNRYARDKDEAKDILQEGFIRIFEQIHTFRHEGSLEGWIRRIMVNIALEHYRKYVRERDRESGSVEHLTEDDHPLSAQDILSHISFNELMQMIQELTPAYRMVFNLYVFEGLKHHEIATQLGISEGTSKSNLADARRILQRRIESVMFDVR